MLAQNNLLLIQNDINISEGCDRDNLHIAPGVDFIIARSNLDTFLKPRFHKESIDTL